MDLGSQNMIMEIITIYRKMKKGRENQNIYRSLLNIGCNHGTSEADELEPSTPSFYENKSETIKNTSVYDFARYRNIRESKYIYFSPSTSLIQSNVLFDNNFELKERLLMGNESPKSSTTSGFYWINIFDPNEKDLQVLAETYGVHDISLIDIREKNTEEKIEIFKHYTFISLKLFSFTNENYDFRDENKFTTKEKRFRGEINTNVSNRDEIKNVENEADDIDFNILMFKDFIITTHDKPWVGINDILNFLSLVSNHTILFPDWVLFSVIIEFLQDLKYIKEEIRINIDLLRDVSSAHEGNIEEILRGNFLLVYKLHNLRNTIKPKISILNNLKTKCKKRMRKNVLKYLSDVFDDFKCQEKEIRQYNKILERCQDLCLAIVAMGQSREGNAMNKSMKWFTMITFIFLPSQTVAGLWGMNVWVPGNYEGSKSSKLWFVFLCLLGPFISFAYLYFNGFYKRKKKNNLNKMEIIKISK